MKMDAIWSRGITLPTYPSVKGNIKTDVLVVGGGMAGILCAYLLKQAGADTVLVESRRICGGITKNTTAKITSQHGLMYDRLLRKAGPEKAKMYLQANEAALAEYRRLCGGIDCHFEEKAAFVYATEDRRALEREVAALRQLAFPAELTDTVPLPFPVAGAVKFPRQAQFHPLEFIRHLVSGLNIYENTPVLTLKKGSAVTPGGTIRADSMIIATHFPFLNTHGSYFLKLYQQRSYVLALENAVDVGGMYIGAGKNSLSFRNAGGLLLLGGGSHRTGKRSTGWQALSRFAARYYPHAREVCRWAAQDCMSLDGMPYIGRYSQNTPNLYVAAGFNKWGMTSAMAAAMLLRDLITGQENPCASVFSPSRNMLTPQLGVNALEAAGNLLRFSAPRCPHMGCALQWNPQERTWDCPCHGSRFAEDGGLLDNPATGDLKL